MPCRLVCLSQETSKPSALGRAWEELVPDERDGIDLSLWPASALVERFDAVAAATAGANVVLLTHLLTEDLAGAALRLLDGQARDTTQVLVLQSLRPLLLRTRLAGRGLPELLQGAPEPLVRLLRSTDMTQSMREVWRELPRFLGALPAAGEGLRLWIECQLCWREPTPANLRGLLLRLAEAHEGAGRFAGRYGPPQLGPEMGLWHPSAGVVEDAALLPGPRAPIATVGLLLMRGSVLAGDVAAAAALTGKLETRGVRVLPAFADSFDFRGAIERWFDPARVDAVLALTGFPLVGGHNRHDPQAAAGFLAERGALWLTPLSLMTQTRESWERSWLGLTPIEVAMELSVSETEGGIEPLVVQGQAGPGGAKELFDERAERWVERLLRWLRLRRLPNADKRLLLTLFSFPPGKGSVGTAAYLDVFRSAHAVLRSLAQSGYTVAVPGTPEELLARVVAGDDKRASFATAELAVGARLDLATYERIVPEWREIARQWGPPPGQLNSDGRGLEIWGAELGNVFVGVQPSFGFEGDPMRLLFEKQATPHHGFAAYYRWAERVFAADAVVHLGTHGAHEFMPGKQAGLSDRCWPDRLLGALPNVYLYAVNNPAEGAIAKRRGYAVTIGHLTPPCEQAGLVRDLAELRALLVDLASSEDSARRRATAEVVVEKARALHLDRDVPVPVSLDGDEVARFAEALAVALVEIETRRIPVGLHVIGERPGETARSELLAAIAEHDRPEAGVRSLLTLLVETRGQSRSAIEAGVRAGSRPAVEALAAAVADLRQVVGALSDVETALGAARRLVPAIDQDQTRRSLDYLRNVAADLERCDELAPLVAALEGRYVRPGAGGDPVRDPTVLPTGRNLHGLDPAAVPSEAALRQAGATVGLLLERRRRELGAWPRRIGLVLWGLDNVKTQGEAIAQAFLLLGTRPRRNSIGRVAEVEVLPLAELGRPRIDVTISASGIFRDLFGWHLQLLDQAVRQVAALDEPPDQNYVRAGAHELEARFGLDAGAAATRVFSNEPGAYGTYVDHLVGLSTWRERADLARVWLDRKSFSFGQEAGRADRHVLQALAAGIDTTFQNIDSSEVSLLDVDHYFEYLGGMTALVEQASGQRPAALVADATTTVARVRGLDEALRLEARTKLLNPRWFEAMLAHGYEGVEEVRKRFDYAFGWSATAEALDAWVYDEVYRTYVADQALRERMRQANPHSYGALVRRLGEASSRGFWQPSDAERQAIHALLGDLEDELEGRA